MISEKDIIYNHVSKVDRTWDGQGFAFIKLDASGKNLTALDSLSSYPHLRIIDISNNGLTSFGNNLSAQTHLTSLIAVGNQLSVLQDSLFGQCKWLQHLDVSNNLITSCEATSWPLLTQFLIKSNQLEAFNIQSAPELKEIEARSNKLSVVNLQQAENQIVDASFVYGKSALKTLHVRNNLIQSLKPFNESTMTCLEYLNMRNNKIEDMDELDHFQSLKALKRLNLQENPICEQENYRLNVIYRLPMLQVLDKEPVTSDEREEGERIRVQNKHAQEEKEQLQRQKDLELQEAESIALNGDTQKSEGDDANQHDDDSNNEPEQNE